MSLQIVFFWVEEFRNLKQATINFGSEYYFQVDKTGDVQNSYTLVAEKNQNFIPNFFQPNGENNSNRYPQIENVTAVVGENASGKSSLLLALRMFLANVDLDSTALIVYKVNGKYNYACKKKGYDINVLARGVESHGNYPNHFSVINYSPMYDFNGPYALNETDVSSNALLRKDMLTFSNTDMYLGHKDGDFMRQMSFTVTANKKILKIIKSAIPLPKKMVLYINSPQIGGNQYIKEYSEETDAGIYRGTSSDAFKDGGERGDSLTTSFIPTNLRESLFALLNNSYLDNTETFLRNESHGELGYTAMEQLLCFHFIHYFITHLTYVIDKGFIHQDWMKANKIQDLRKKICKPILIHKYSLEKLNTLSDDEKTRLIEEIAGYLNELSKNTETLIKKQQLFESKPLLEFFKSICKIINNYHERSDKQYDGSLRIEIPLAGKQNHIELIKKVLRVRNTYLMELATKITNPNFDVYATDFLHFDWLNMSSGEKAYLNLFSRLHYAKEVEDKSKNDKAILLLIDEGELGFHLAWQKRYINNLLKVVPHIFGNRAIQFVFATHSPVSLSDIPNEHIVYLPKDENATKSIQLRKTFAANIHDLLRHSFFMQEGSIGEFAKEQVNRMINKIKKDELSPKEFADLEKQIKIIGEPLLERELLRQLYSKQETNQKIKRLIQKQAEIAKEIEELQKDQAKEGGNNA